MPRFRRLATTGLPTVAALALALVLTTITPSASAQTTTATTTPAASYSSGNKPTVVLVHGAWADSSSWTEVAVKLQRDGYSVFAPPNPLRSLSGDAEYLRQFLATVSGPVILVGHSYGGAVITNAATGNANVEALVYVDAFAPDQGETVNSLTGAGSALAGSPGTLFDVRPYPGAPADDADVYLKPAVMVQSFAQDLPKRAAAALAVTQRPVTLVAGNEPSGVPAWRTIPSWYLLGTQDKIITPTSQRAMAERAQASIVEVRASHVSLMSRPGAVEKIIVAAARATT